MPRLFVAIDIPENIKDDICDTYLAIRGARWMDEEHLHLSLRFIGDVDGAGDKKVQYALRTIMAEQFSIRIKGVGVFPLRKEPRILWLGVENNPILLHLQNKIERAITAAGLPPESRNFSPHITVARLNNSPPAKVIEYLTENSLFSTEPFDVLEFSLYSSIIGKSGAYYTKEESYLLN